MVSVAEFGPEVEAEVEGWLTLLDSGSRLELVESLEVGMDVWADVGVEEEVLAADDVGSELFVNACPPHDNSPSSFTPQTSSDEKIFSTNGVQNKTE